MAEVHFSTSWEQTSSREKDPSPARWLSQYHYMQKGSPIYIYVMEMKKIKGKKAVENEYHLTCFLEGKFILFSLLVQTCCLRRGKALIKTSCVEPVILCIGSAVASIYQMRRNQACFLPCTLPKAAAHIYSLMLILRNYRGTQRQRFKMRKSQVFVLRNKYVTWTHHYT